MDVPDVDALEQLGLGWSEQSVGDSRERDLSIRETHFRFYAIVSC